ncbi:MAG TPA: Ig-like domain-containing protein, partial [Pyrinomonadaceae bacterium]|nr:Ig-like domain-containing protein [Pyrinomonadaceae bacterium]
DAAPTVTSTTPINGATNQATNTDITITFSEPVNVTGNWFQIVCGAVTRNVVDTVVTGGPTTFTINPNTDLAGGQTCTTTIFAAQVADQDTNDPPDNMAANFVFSFTTDAPPSVTSNTPVNGATQVANNTNVSLTFSEPVDVTGNWFTLVGATSGTRNVADTVVTGGPTTFTINPNADFANGELVTVTVFAAQVTDQDSGDPPDNMAANHVFSFTIDQAPSVTATTPTNGAVNQALNQNVSITFSEPVNVTGNWFQIACGTSGTRNPADTVVTGGPTTFTINPNADFVTSETCTVTVVAAQVTDQDSGDPPDNMTANFVFSFLTLDAAPTVTSTMPTNGATNQATNNDITVTFSEPVNVTGNWFQIVCGAVTRNVVDTVVTGGPTTFTINPNTDFAASQTCTTTIFASQVTDQDTNDPPDNMAANFVFSFTTDGPPAVTTTIPTAGATQVGANTNITINFNENVNIQDDTAFIVECPVATPIAFTVTPPAPGGTNSFTLDPTSDLPLATICTVTVVASKVTDVDAGDPPDNMAANFVFSFTTDQAPSVTTTIPADNAVEVLQSSTVTINFSENVDVAINAVTINCGSAVTLPAAPQNNITSLVLSPTLPAGSTCTVTVDKTKISDTDAGDPPDNMVNDFVFSFKVKPDAVNDAFPANVVGNVRINTAGFPFSITTNDVSANAFSITEVQGVTTVVTNTIAATTVNGGSIVMIVSGTDRGKFIYNPPAGFEGTDSFGYKISRDDGGGTDTATVNIPVSGMIWFVNNAASCPCDGRLTNPFNTLAAFQAVNNGAGNNPAINDNIFVYESGTAYVGPVTLLNNQKFIGQDAVASLSTISGLTPPAGSDALPVTNSGNGTIVNITSAGIGITVAQNNTLRGFTGGNAAPDITGTSFGTLNISDITLNGTGQALSLSTGTLAATFGSISSTNSAATGISLTSVAGSLTSGSTTISNPTGIGVSVNTSSGTLNFGNTVSTLSGGTAVSLTTNTGAITFGILDISPDNNQRGLLATDNTNTITTTSGTLVTNGAAAVEISRASSTTPLAVALTSVSTTGGPNGIFLRNTSGSFGVNGDGANTAVGGNFTGGTISGITGADGATSGNGVYLENAANVTLRRIRINGTNQNHGIRGVNTSNFTLEFSTVTGTNGTSAALDEGAVNFDNLTGTAAITSCIIEGGFEDNLNVINTSGVLNRMTISGTTFGFNGSGTGNNNIQIESLNAGTTLNFTLKSSLIKGARADFLNALASSGSTMDAVIGGPLVADGNTFDNLAPNNHPTSAAGGNRVVTTAVGTQTVDIRNNTLRGSRGEAIRVRSTISSPLRGNVNARVRNNTIGVAGTANSGSSESFGVF